MDSVTASHATRAWAPTGPDGDDVCPTVPLPARRLDWPRFTFHELWRTLTVAELHIADALAAPYIDSYGGREPLLAPLTAAAIRAVEAGPVRIEDAMGGVVHPSRLAYLIAGMTQHDAMHGVLLQVLVPVLTPLLKSPRDNDFVTAWFLSSCVLGAYPHDTAIHEKLCRFKDLRRRVAEVVAETPRHYDAQADAKAGRLYVPLLRVVTDQ